MVKKCCCSEGSSGHKKSSSAGGTTGISVCGNTVVEHVKVSNFCEKDKHSSKVGSTKIIAEVDIGFGNTLYIRGAGCGLSWDKGVAMKNKDAKFWVFECDKCKGKGDFEYKLLINDELWCDGDNFVAKYDQKNIVVPTF
ncbi:MAG: hypothetical protein LBF25_01210 [Puniceicoccales bacterium]|jgi:hypothetical protein|nr:hypothetical protein [Puniceicoccales bacterium]